MQFNTVAMVAPGTWDAFNRVVNYMTTAEKNATALLLAMQNNPGEHRRIAQQAVELRNQLLEATRGRSTPFGRAFSEALKEEGKNFAELLDMYKQRISNNSAQLVSPIDRFRAAARAVAGQRYPPGDLESGNDFWQRARIDYLREILRAAASNYSPKVSEHVIRASGRTNLTVNRFAYASLGLGVAVTMVGACIAIAAFPGDVSISNGVLDALSITNWETAVRAGVGTLASLGTGTVARRIGTATAVRNLTVQGRVGTVVILHVGMLFLLMWLLNLGLDQLI